MVGGHCKREICKMVYEKNKEGEIYFICDKCNLAYHEKEKAEQCEKWCNENPGSCDPNAVKFSVELD